MERKGAVMPGKYGGVHRAQITALALLAAILVPLTGALLAAMTEPFVIISGVEGASITLPRARIVLVEAARDSVIKSQTIAPTTPRYALIIDAARGLRVQNLRILVPLDSILASTRPRPEEVNITVAIARSTDVTIDGLTIVLTGNYTIVGEGEDRAVPVSVSIIVSESSNVTLRNITLPPSGLVLKVRPPRLLQQGGVVVYTDSSVRAFAVQNLTLENVAADTTPLLPQPPGTGNYGPRVLAFTVWNLTLNRVDSTALRVLASTVWRVEEVDALALVVSYAEPTSGPTLGLGKINASTVELENADVSLRGSTVGSLKASGMLVIVKDSRVMLQTEITALMARIENSTLGKGLALRAADARIIGSTIYSGTVWGDETVIVINDIGLPSNYLNLLVINSSLVSEEVNAVLLKTWITGNNTDWLITIVNSTIRCEAVCRLIYADVSSARPGNGTLLLARNRVEALNLAVGFTLGNAPRPPAYAQILLIENNISTDFIRVAAVDRVAIALNTVGPNNRNRVVLISDYILLPGYPIDLRARVALNRFTHNVVTRISINGELLPPGDAPQSELFNLSRMARWEEPVRYLGNMIEGPGNYYEPLARQYEDSDDDGLLGGAVGGIGREEKILANPPQFYTPLTPIIVPLYPLPSQSPGEARITALSTLFLAYLVGDIVTVYTVGPVWTLPTSRAEPVWGEILVKHEHSQDPLRIDAMQVSVAMEDNPGEELATTFIQVVVNGREHLTGGPLPAYVIYEDTDTPGPIEVYRSNLTLPGRYFIALLDANGNIIQLVTTTSGGETGWTIQLTGEILYSPRWRALVAWGYDTLYNLAHVAFIPITYRSPPPLARLEHERPPASGAPNTPTPPPGNTMTPPIPPGETEAPTSPPGRGPQEKEEGGGMSWAVLAVAALLVAAGALVAVRRWRGAR